ncbi:MAG: glycosyltransferase family 2 protein, partial [Pseudorhodoplanes sp.]
MSAPIVTVYIPCRNYGRYLEQSVRSVLGQLYKHWELFIVDEASDDDTAVVAERCRALDPERIKIIKNRSPIGLQRLANHVLGRANGKYFMRLDADDWLDESALLLMVAKLQSDPQLGLVYGNYFYTDASGNVLGMERRPQFGVEDTSGHVPPHGACTMVSTRALKAVGGYSEDVDAQDGWELWFKLLNRVDAASLEAPLFFYRQHELSLSRSASRLLIARSKIFSKIRQALEGSYVPTCLAVIGARESYPGFEGVPYRLYEGISLLQRAIVSAAAARGVTDVYVSSEDRAVLDYAEDLQLRG